MAKKTEVVSFTGEAIALELVKKAEGYKEIVDQEHFTRGAEMIARLRKASRVIDKDREKYKAPSLEEGRRIDTMAKIYLVPLAQAAEMVEGGMLGYYEAHRDDESYIKTVTGVADSTVTFTERPGWEVTDIEQVPKEFTAIVADIKAINEHFANGGADLPGIKRSIKVTMHTKVN